MKIALTCFILVLMTSSQCTINVYACPRHIPNAVNVDNRLEKTQSTH